MIKTDLSYNPYTMKTEVKFNGHAPRINSLVEKYDKLMLQEWIKLVPKIFYDEMNGYDFELEYSGTKADYEELEESFKKAGVTEKQVRLVLKKEILGREETSVKVEQLLQWLEEHRNRKFEYDGFKEKNAEVLDVSYPYIVIHGNAEIVPALADLHFVIENISSIEELENTILINIPILYCVKLESKSVLQNELKLLIKRQDVKQEQLFFIVSEGLCEETVARVLRDLGIKYPQIVSQVDDERILKYMKVYPISTYICHALNVLRKEANELEIRVKAETEAATETNREIYNRIERMDQELELLKNAWDKFEQRDNLIIPSKMLDAKKQLMNKIANWRNRKTKISDYSNAKQYAMMFNTDAHSFYVEYIRSIRTEQDKIKNEIFNKYADWYKSGNAALGFVVKEGNYTVVKEQEIPSFDEELLKMRDEQYVEAKDDLLVYLFKGQSPAEKKKVLEQIWDYQEWRNYVANIIGAEADKVPIEAFEILKEYTEFLANEYMRQLKNLIEQKIIERDREKLLLSKEEQMLQEDNEWVVNLIDQICKIERG